MTELSVSQEFFRLRAASQLRRIFEDHYPTVPVSIQRLADAHLWGQLSVEAMLKLRELPDKTARVYASLSSLLMGSARQVLVSEIAFLANLEDRQTREHLRRLEEAGLIGKKHSRIGPTWFWLSSSKPPPASIRSPKPRRALGGHSRNTPAVLGPIDVDDEFLEPTTPSAIARAPDPESCRTEVQPAPDPTPVSNDGDVRPIVVAASLRLPIPLGSLGLPSNDQISKDQPPLKGSPSEISGEKGRGGGAGFLSEEYFEQKAAHQVQQKSFMQTCEEVRTELADQLISKAQNEAVCNSVENGELPRWWVELLDAVSISGHTLNLLHQAAPRSKDRDLIHLAMLPLFASLSRPKLEEIDSAFWMACGCPGQRAKVLITSDKKPDETSIADVQAQVQIQGPTTSEVKAAALKRLCWGSEPECEGLECIDRYGASDRQVVDLAKKVAGEGRAALELLEEWAKVPVEAILELERFEAQKTKDKDPVRNHSRWWRPALAAIQERLGSPRRCCSASHCSPC